jgi:hypothetical protein
LGVGISRHPEVGVPFLHHRNNFKMKRSFSLPENRANVKITSFP